MYENELKKRKVFQVMTPEEFLRSFLGISIIGEKTKISQKEFHFIAGPYLKHASQCEVNPASTETGNIIIIRFPDGKRMPYYRPNFNNNFGIKSVITLPQEKPKNLSLSEILSEIWEEEEITQFIESMIGNNADSRQKVKVKGFTVDRRRH